MRIYIDEAVVYRIYGKDHKEFQAFLSSSDDRVEQNVNLLVPIDGILSEERVEPDGPITLHISVGSNLYRRELVSFKVGRPIPSDRDNKFFVEDFIVPPIKKAIPAS